MASILAPSYSVCLSFYFYEVIAEIVKRSPEMEVRAALQEALETTHGRAPTRKEVEQAAIRLQEDSRKDGSEGNESSTAHKKGFAGGLFDWIQSLNAEDTCILVAEYDPDKAKHLYTKVDRDLVLAMAKVKTNLIRETAVVQFEAVLFGMGGGYKGHTAQDGQVINLSEMDHDPTILKQLGMMH